MQFDISDDTEHPPAEDLAGRSPNQRQEQNKASSAGLRRTGQLLLAGIFFVLGVLGAVLPFLPATPFFLLTSYFLVRSSPRLNSALLRSRFFGPILLDWQRYRSVRRNVKVKVVVIVIATVCGSIYLTSAPPGPAMSVIALAMIGIIVVLRLPEPG